MTAHHPAFDLKYWRNELADTWQDLGQTLFSDSPVSIVTVEQYRAAAVAQGFQPVGVIPTDRMVLAKGSPPKPYLTKINGLPYRPADRPWPLDSTGYPMAFVAQFYFGDSMDHVGPLPGDVLLVFIRVTAPLLTGGRVFDPSDDSAIEFEWYDLGLANLATKADVPRREITFPECYALRHRSEDFLDDARAIKAIENAVPPHIMVNSCPMEEWFFRGLATYPRLKIGGRPFWCMDPEECITERFLFSFSGVQLQYEAPFPWANVREPLSLRQISDDENWLPFFDGCVILNFFLDPTGNVRWTIGSG